MPFSFRLSGRWYYLIETESLFDLVSMDLNELGLWLAFELRKPGLLRGLTLPITGLQQAAKRAVAIPVDWRVGPQ